MYRLLKNGDVSDSNIESPYSTTGLEPDTEYSLQIERLADGIVVGRSNIINVRTAEAEPEPEPPVIDDSIQDFFDQTNADGFYRPIWNTSTLFQDAAGTIPVTQDGDPVGLSLDVSGNNKHITQTVAGSRPIYRTDGVYHWLEFDTAGKFLFNNDIKLTNPDDFASFNAVEVNPTGETVIPFAFTNSTTGSGVMYVINASGHITDRLRSLNILRDDADYYDKLLILANRVSKSDTLSTSIVNDSVINEAVAPNLDSSEAYVLGRQRAVNNNFPALGRYYGGGCVINTHITLEQLDQFKNYIASKSPQN